MSKEDAAKKAKTGVARTPRKASTSRSKASTAAKAVSFEDEMARLTAAGGEVRRYTIAETFQVGDRIDHKKFGPGFIVAVLGDGKVNACFASGEKTLIHGRQ